MSTSAPDDALPLLLSQREKFVSFVEGRVRDRALAEDLVQECLARALAHHAELRDAQSPEAWLYRSLRNAIVDHWRRIGARERLSEELARQAETAEDSTSAPEIGRVCACVTKVVAELKPEYTEVLERVEVDGMAVKDFAVSMGISASNAGVRVHRAREALRRKVQATCGACAAEGCKDCTCSVRV